jgi:redox-sensitive bicupin YhaK (pirin superfamily)
VILATTRLSFPWQTFDPFLLCVHHRDAYPAGNERMGPAASLKGRQIGQDFEAQDGWRMYHGSTVPGFPQHPHRGFETVTVVRSGYIDHSDSLGATARYGAGDVQWLTAGGGIQHAEMFPLRDPHGPNPLELFQVWLNLPRDRKMVSPYFSMFWHDTVPAWRLEDESGRSVEVVVVAGRLETLDPPAPPPDSWAAEPDSEVAIWMVRLSAGAGWTLPRTGSGVGRTLYFFQGDTLEVGGRSVPAGSLVQLRPDADASLVNGRKDADLLLLQGRPIGEPVVQYGPFVMNTDEEIQQAFLDYRRTQFGGWPWPVPDPVHPREEEPFALHPDGRFERGP